MPIVSISLGQEMADELDRLQASLGFSGRSEVVRAGLKMLSADSK